MLPPGLQATHSPRSSRRIRPEIEAGLRAMMPRNSPIAPLRLFRTLVHDPRLAEAMTRARAFSPRA